MGRRPFGSVRQLPSGRWQARYRSTDGSQTSAPRTFTTKREATKFLAAAETDQMRGEWRDPRAGQMAFADWADIYLDAAAHKRASTLAQDRHVLNRHLLPHFGHLPLAAITPLHVKAFMASLAAGDLKPSTIRSIATKLRAILNGAVAADLIPRSPVGRLALPRNSPPDIRIVTPDELNRLAAAMAEPYRPMIYLAGFLGLRFGEMAGLRVKRLDLLNRRLSVLETASQLGYFAEPKTPASRRTLGLPDFIAQMLAAHLQLRGLDATDGDALVFVAPRGGRLHENNWHRRDWQPAIAAAGLTGLTPHGLRHSAAATMIQLGAHPKAIQERLGHENIRTTLDVYGHIFEQVDTDLTSKLEQHFAGSGGAAPTVTRFR